jgi:hypothetical protein
MRSVYAVHLELNAGTAPEDVVAVAADWFARGRAPAEVRTDWTSGRRAYELGATNNTLAIEVFASQAGRLWEGTWRHPHAEDPDLHLVSDVSVCEADDHVTFSLVIRAVWAKAKVSPPRFSMRCPRLVRDVLSRFEAVDAREQLTAAPRVLDAAGVGRFVEELLLSQERTRPVVFVSDDPRLMRPNVDPNELARELAGLAHVYYSLYGRPGWMLSRQLRTLGCGDGAMRIWWPGLTLTSDPFRHTLFLGDSLRNWHGRPPTDLLFRRISAAAATNAAPPEQARVRREARRAELRTASDAELEGYVEQLLDETIDLKAERDNAVASEGELQVEVERLEVEVERLKRDMALVVAAPASSTPLTAVEEDVEPPSSVLDAVRRAQVRCHHLAFADSAFESAEESPYRDPDGVLEALEKLERLAALWARPGGIGGKDLGAMATELGLSWRTDVSKTALGGKTGRYYRFSWDEEERVMGPHVRLGSGSGASNIARIYLAKHEPRDPRERRLIVGHVGRKLPDTTT